MVSVNVKHYVIYLLSSAPTLGGGGWGGGLYREVGHFDLKKQKQKKERETSKTKQPKTQGDREWLSV